MRKQCLFIKTIAISFVEIICNGIPLTTAAVANFTLRELASALRKLGNALFCGSIVFIIFKNF
ncbi:hypothetical protein SLEP1_g30538 [Rubroshorea leprosula]|uniref:Uncharacterized protein n=1 Tax=Rubroshorea leprosula TaxID=152421 RepID=A0AAV5K8Q8_9ROSI|nr:hypothetical protein SLEP1_g30538 [Rubroshorea leprosula]